MTTLRLLQCTPMFEWDRTRCVTTNVALLVEDIADRLSVVWRCLPTCCCDLHRGYLERCQCWMATAVGRLLADKELLLLQLVLLLLLLYLSTISTSTRATRLLLYLLMVVSFRNRVKDCALQSPGYRLSFSYCLVFFYLSFYYYYFDLLVSITSFNFIDVVFTICCFMLFIKKF